MQHTKQKHLDVLHEVMLDQAQMWNSGLITDLEIARLFSEIYNNLQTKCALQNLIDPATGLRYE